MISNTARTPSFQYSQGYPGAPPAGYQQMYMPSNLPQGIMHYGVPDTSQHAQHAQRVPQHVHPQLTQPHMYYSQQAAVQQQQQYAQAHAHARAGYPMVMMSHPSTMRHPHPQALRVAQHAIPTQYHKPEQVAVSTTDSSAYSDTAEVARDLLSLSDHGLSDGGGSQDGSEDDSVPAPPARANKPHKAKRIKQHKEVAKGSKRDRLRDQGRRYSCTNCNKRFVSPSKLRRHMLVHSGVKQYGCRICHSRFGQKSALVVHLKRKHPQMLEVALQQMNRQDASGSDSTHTVPKNSKNNSGAEAPLSPEPQEYDDDEEETDVDAE